MALVPLDDQDLENMDFTKCKENIVKLQAGRERRLEATERLQEKLKALNNELAARRLEADQRRLELKEEQNRNKQHAAEQRERGDVQLAIEGRTEEDQTKVRNFIEEMIAEKATGGQKKEKQLSSYGFRIFDETELMVEKPMDAAALKESPVDTVLVTHQKPNSDDVRYHLSYRVSKETPSKKLREDACNYWNLSEVEYILLTVENSKVHDDVILQRCFKPNERCQLILAPKDPRRQVMMDKELEATRPRSGKGAKREKKTNTVVAEDPSKKSNQASSFVDWLQAKPGVWDFMVQRDRNVTDHLTRIKLRSIVIYFLFLVCSMVLFYYVKPPAVSYYMREGPLKAMTSSATDPLSGEAVSAYSDIKTQEQAWRWLTYTVSNQLMKSDSDLRTHNYLVGWLRVRMQQGTAPANTNCKPQDLPPPSDLQCVDEKYKGADRGTEDLEFVRLYWNGYNATTTTTSTTSTTTFEGQFGSRRLLESSQDEPDALVQEIDRMLQASQATDGSDLDEARRLYYEMAPWTKDYPYTSDIPTLKGTDGRSAKVQPWSFLSGPKNSADHGVVPISGQWQNYDSSGYNSDYNLQHSNLTALYDAYRADMMAVRERGWFTSRTRSIILSFSLYSTNYDLWVQNDFILEMPTSSIVVPVVHSDVFSPSMKDTSNHQVVFWVDLVRLIFAKYVLLAQTRYEIKEAKKRDESYIFGYLLTPVGLADIFIGLLAVVIWLIREGILFFVISPETFLRDLVLSSDGFESLSGVAWLYRFQFQLEAPLFCLLIFRLFSFLRINRQIYILWQTIVDAARLYIPFCLVLAPIGFGLVIWAHGLWHMSQREYTSLASSAMSLIMMVHGDVNVDKMFRTDRPDTLFFGVVLFVVTWLLLVNAWIAVLVHTYQKTRQHAGYSPSDYRWKEMHYVVWSLYKPLARMWFRLIRPRVEKPKAFTVPDDDDDDK